MINKIIKKFFYTLIKVSNTRGLRAQRVPLALCSVLCAKNFTKVINKLL